MKILPILLLPLVSVLLLSGCLTAPTVVTLPVQEKWNFKFDERSWELGHQAATRQGSTTIREYVLQGQTVHNWTEMVSSYTNASSVSLKALYAQFCKSMSAGCPSFHSTVIEESADNIVFEWQHDGCQGHPAQHEIRRYVRTPSGTLSLSYVEKTRQLSAKKRTAWLDIIRQAKVRPGA